MRAHQTIILTAPPSDSRAALSFGVPVAHMAYRIGPGPHLLRANMPLSVRGGLMVIDDTGFDGRGTCEALCQELLRECSSRGLDGILCDFESRPLSLLGTLVGELGEATHRRGWPLYVTEAYARFSDKTQVLIPSALSGGSLQQRLLDAIDQYGVSRVVLGVERVAEDFFLPAPAGQGVPLSRAELARRREALAPSVFFSNELCAYYFTYMSKQNGAHFVLYDDGGSIRKKLHVALCLGITTAVLAYPDVDDLLPEILGNR